MSGIAGNDSAVLSLRINTGTAGADLTAIGNALDNLARPRNTPPVKVVDPSQVKDVENLAKQNAVLTRQLADTNAQLAKFKTGLDGIGNATASAGKVTASYRAIIDGVSVSYRESTKHNSDYVKQLSAADAIQKRQMQTGSEIVAMLRRRAAEEKAAAAAQKASLAEQQAMMAGMAQARATWQKLGQQQAAAEIADIQRVTAAQRAAAAEQKAMLAGMESMRQSWTRMQQAANNLNLSGQRSSDWAKLRTEMSGVYNMARLNADGFNAFGRQLSGVKALLQQFGPEMTRSFLGANKSFMVSEVANLERYRTSMKNVGDATRNAGWETKGFTDAQNALHSALRGVGGSLGMLWLTYGKYISVMVAAGAATKVFKDSVTRGMETDFAAQFVSVLQTKGPLDTALKDQIRNTLIDVSEKSIFTTKENAEALKKLALAGIEASRGLKLLETASNAAIFSQTQLGDATTMILDTLNNFGMSSENSLIMADNFERVGNVMAYTANTVNASFSDIAKAFQNVTGVAGTFKIEIEEASVLLQSLARAGIRGQKSGTYLRNFLDDLLGAPTSKKAEEVLKELGVARYDADSVGEGDFGVAKYIDDLIAKLRTLDFVQQQDAIRAISNQRSRRVLRQELNEYNTVLSRTIALSEGAEGSLSKLAEGLGQNAQMSFKLAQAAYDASVTRAFAGNEDMFRQIGLDMQELFKSDAFKDFAAAGVKSIAEIGSAFVGAMKFITEFKDGIVFMGSIALWSAIALGIGKVGLALKALVLANPVLLGITAVLVTGAAVAQYVKDLEESGKTLEGVNEKIAATEDSIAFLNERLDETPDTFWTKSQREMYGSQKAENEAYLVELQQQRDALVEAMKVSPNAREEVRKSLEELEKAYADGMGAMREAARAGASEGVSVDVLNLSYVIDETRRMIPAAQAAGEEVNRLRESILSSSPAYAAYVDWAKASNMSAEDQATLFAKVIPVILGLNNEYFKAAGTARIMEQALDNLNEEMERLQRAALNTNIADAFAAWNKINLSDNLKFDPEFFSGLDQTNEKLAEEIRLLKLGEEGIFQQEQAYKRKQVAAIEAQIALTRGSMAMMSADGAFTAALLTQVKAMEEQVASLNKNIDLSQTLFDAKAAAAANKGGSRGGGIDRDPIRAQIEAAKTAVQEYKNVLQEAQSLINEQRSAFEIGPVEAHGRAISALADNYGEMIAKLKEAQSIRGIKETERQKLETDESKLVGEMAKAMAKANAELAKAQKEQADTLEALEIQVGKKVLSARESWLREYEGKNGNIVSGLMDDIVTLEAALSDAVASGDTAAISKFTTALLKARNALSSFEKLKGLGAWAAETAEAFKLAEDSIKSLDAAVATAANKSKEGGLYGVLLGTAADFDRANQARIAMLRRTMDELVAEREKRRANGLPLGEVELKITNIQQAMDEASAEVDPTIKGWGDSLGDYIARGLVYGFDQGESPAKAFGNFLKAELVKAIAQALSMQFAINLSALFGAGGATGGAAGAGNAMGSLQNYAGMANTAMTWGGKLVGNGLAAGYANTTGTGLDGMIQVTNGWGTGGGASGAGLGAVGSGLAAYGIAQKHGPVAGFVGGAATSALVGGASSMVAGGTFASGALAALGPWGWAALAIGALLGGMGGKPSNKAAWGEIDLGTGTTSDIGAMTGKKAPSEQTLSARDYFLAKSGAFAQAVGATGSVKFDIGERDGIQAAFDGGKMQSLGNDPSTAMQEVLDRILESATLDPAIIAQWETLRQKMDGTTRSGGDMADAMILLVNNVSAMEIERATLIQGAEESMGQSYLRLAEIMGTTRTATDNWRSAQRALQDQFARINQVVPTSIDGFRNLANSIDISTSAGAQMYQQLMALGPAFMQMAQMMDEASKSISATAASSLEEMRMSVMTDQEKYAYNDSLIATNREKYETLLDPSEIAALFEENMKLIVASWNLVPEDQRKAMLPDFERVVGEEEALAKERLTLTDSEYEPNISESSKGVDGSSADAIAEAILSSIGSAGGVMLSAGQAQMEAANTLAAAIGNIPNSISLHNHVSIIGSEVGR